jgi:hypothetical protein
MLNPVFAGYSVKHLQLFLIVALSLALVTWPTAQSPTGRTAAASGKPRVVLTHDPELDDVNTVIRALLYSTDFTIEGLVYTSANFHFRGDGKGTTQYIAGREYARMGRGPVTSWRWPDKERWIDEIVDAYAKVHANLKVHDPDYPSPTELRSKIKWGNVEFDGDYSKDTDGSNLIKSLLLDNQPGPLFVTAGGGQSTIARALRSIYADHGKAPQWDAIREKVSRKLVIIPFGDQDGTNGRYIRPNWPDVTTWQLAMINFGYGARGSHTPENQVYLGTPWTMENVSSRGPLGALYRVWGDGKHMSTGDPTDYFGQTGVTADELRAKGYNVWTPPREKGSFISEGDTPTFMNFLDNGLRAYEDGSWGGWGGRRRADATGGGGRGGAVTPAGPDDPGVAMGLAPAGSTANAPPPPAAATENPATAGRGRNPAGGQGGAGRGGAAAGGQAAPSNTALVNARFFAAAQHDFAARLKWSVTPTFQGANHEPVVRIDGPLALSGRPGDTIRLRGIVNDPDPDTVTVRWWQYHDAGTYPGEIVISSAGSLDTTLQIPTDAQPGQSLHVILEATDSGTPSLTRYQRVIVTIRQSSSGRD